LPQALQFQDQRGALRTDAVAVLFSDPAPRRFVIILRAICWFAIGDSHG
jgi:hypothetical protein